jgi:uncharacterized membrane protein
MGAAHVILIVSHLSAATLAFILGIALCARLPGSAKSVSFRAYAVSVWLAMLCLVTVVILDWPRLNLTRHIAFSVLGVLGVYLIWRTERARRQLRDQRPGWRLSFVSHIGFVLISLFDGFCIVLAIDLLMPAWVVITVAVLGVAVGIIALRARAKTIRAVEAA